MKPHRGEVWFPNSVFIQSTKRNESKPMIDGKTRLIGLLGNPVSHSLSPLIHNAALQEMGINWTYVAFQCESHTLNAILKGLQALDCKGLNITIPHKQVITEICANLSEISNQLKAVNTLIPKDGEWFGDNTDVEGFVTPLLGNDLENKTAIVLGCGGSARATIAGLKKLKVSSITIVGRNQDSLSKIVDELYNINEITTKKDIKIEGIIQTEKGLVEKIKEAGIIINTTPVGMFSYKKPNQSYLEVPLGEKIWNNLEGGTIMYDLIYTPRPTKWLRVGRKYGCHTIDGLEMLINQGAASLRLWTNYTEIPINLMRKTAENHLQG